MIDTTPLNILDLVANSFYKNRKTVKVLVKNEPVFGLVSTSYIPIFHWTLHSTNVTLHSQIEIGLYKTFIQGENHNNDIQHHYHASGIVE